MGELFKAIIADTAEGCVNMYINLKKIMFVIVFAILYFLPNSCAKQILPSGGEGDKTPPKIVDVFPSDKSTNVAKNQKITINFSEWINPKSAESGIIISPRIDFSIRVRGRTLEITPKVPFEENASYRLSILSDISDFSNNSLAAAQTIIFSTGTFIDTSFIEGRVFFEKSDSALPKIALFFDKRVSGRDSVLFSPPDYITQTDSSGNFKFDNISNARYRIIGFIDKNRSNKIAPSKRVFIGENQTVETNNFVELLPAKCDTVQNKAASLQALSSNVLEMKLKFPSENDPFYSLKVLNPKDSQDVRFESVKKAGDNLTFAVFLRDSLQNQPYFIETKSQKIFINDEDSIFCDTIKFNGTTFSDTAKLAKLDSLFLTEPNEKIFGDSAALCPRLSWNYSGELPQNPLWEIKGKEKSVYYTNKNFIENIPEGKYTISLIYDNNQNGKYDSGTLFPFVGGEKIISFPDTLIARGRWEVEYDINSDR